MTVAGQVAKRIAMGLATAWALVTVVFLAFTVTGDWVAERIEGNIRFGSGIGGDVEETERQVEEALGQYAASRGLNRPISEQYVDWLWRMITLDWGESFRTGEPVTPLVVEAAARSGTYVVPAILLAVAIGTGVGVYASMRSGRLDATVGRLTTYALFALPSFWIGGLLISYAWTGHLERGTLLFERVLPVVLTTMTLLGGYVSYSRAYAMEHVSAEYVTLVRAKGAGPRRIARHVLRNAAIPLFSMLFMEALGLLVLAIFVIELVFGIDGFGLVFLRAIQGRDLPVILGCTLIIIAVGIVANIVQDLSYQYLDPRV